MNPVAVVEQFLDAFERHDLEGMLALLAADAYFVPSGQDFAPGYGDFSGHAGWRAWWDAARGADLSLDGLKIRQLDDQRVLAELLIGAPRGGGWEGFVRLGVYTVRDGKLATLEIFADIDAAYARLFADTPAIRAD